jgi:hypothetical protein
MVAFCLAFTSAYMYGRYGTSWKSPSGKNLINLIARYLIIVGRIEGFRI